MRATGHKIQNMSQETSRIVTLVSKPMSKATLARPTSREERTTNIVATTSQTSTPNLTTPLIASKKSLKFMEVSMDLVRLSVWIQKFSLRWASRLSTRNFKRFRLLIFLSQRLSQLMPQSRVRLSAMFSTSRKKDCLQCAAQLKIWKLKSSWLNPWKISKLFSET